mgnify:CR=1 FL=1
MMSMNDSPGASAVQRPKISQPLSNEGLTYGVSQLRLVDQESTS